MSTAFAALGCQLWIGDGASPDTFFKVNQVGDIAGPKSKKATIKTTTHDNAVVNGGDNYETFVASLLDAQSVTFMINLDPADITHNETPTVVGTNAGGLKYLLEDVSQPRNMRIALPFTSPPARVRFKGVVIGMAEDMKVAGVLTSDVEIKVSGKPTLEPGTGNAA